MSTILVVDDNLFCRRTLVHALRLAGHQAVGTASPQRALQFMRDRSIDLLLVSLQLGECDTVTFLREVKQEVPYGILPIIVMTHTSQHDGVLLASQLGIQEVHLKPRMPLGRILAYVRQHLHRVVSKEGTLMAWG